jgi:hypothetical protein
MHRCTLTLSTTDLGTTAKKVDDEVGAPSYTSGDYI